MAPAPGQVKTLSDKKWRVDPVPKDKILMLQLTGAFSCLVSIEIRSGGTGRKAV
jgi:hypothetical protein